MPAQRSLRTRSAIVASVGHEHAAVPSGQVLRSLKTETADVSESAEHAPLVAALRTRGPCPRQR